MGMNEKEEEENKKKQEKEEDQTFEEGQFLVARCILVISSNSSLNAELPGWAGYPRRDRY